MPEWNFYSKVAGSYLPWYGFNHKVRKNRVKLKLVFISEHAVPLNSEWKLILHYLQHRKKEKNMCNRNLCQITEGRFYLRRAVPLLPLLLLLLLPLVPLLLYSMIMSLFGERSGFFQQHGWKLHQIIFYSVVECSRNETKQFASKVDLIGSILVHFVN